MNRHNIVRRVAKKEILMSVEFDSNRVWDATRIGSCFWGKEKVMRLI
jgi:hypothetical protein